MEELVSWDPSITSESIHHTGVGRDGKHTRKRRTVSHRAVRGTEATHPQKYMHPMTITINTIAPLVPTVSRKICVTG